MTTTAMHAARVRSALERRRRPLVWMRILPAVLLVLSMPAPFASATTRLEITVLGGSVTAQGGGDAYFETENATTEPFSFCDGASSAAGHASSAGHVGYGWARAGASANHGAANTGISSGSNASTQSKFVDDLTVTADGVTGSGSVTFRIDVHGSLSASSTSEGSFRAASDWSVFAGSSTLPPGSRIGEGTLSDSQFGVLMTGDQDGGAYDFTVAFGYGTLFEITIALNATSDVDLCCSSAADFGSTLTWGGVVEMRDSQGELVTEFTITSGSGADYGSAIAAPEPAAAVLAGAALISLHGLARRRS